jgi:hypothetical protein
VAPGCEAVRPMTASHEGRVSPDQRASIAASGSAVCQAGRRPNASIYIATLAVRQVVAASAWQQCFPRGVAMRSALGAVERAMKGRDIKSGEVSKLIGKKAPQRRP